MKEDGSEFQSFKRSNSFLNFDQTLVDWEENTDKVQIVTTRTDFGANGLNTLHILLRTAVIDQDIGSTNFLWSKYKFIKQFNHFKI